MKKLEWNYLNQDPHKEDIDINLILEHGSKKTNAWWKDLPAWKDFAKTHVNAFHQMAKDFFSGKISFEDISETNTVGTAKICPAIGKGILDKSFLLKTPCDIIFSIDTNGEWIWKSPQSGLVQISSHPRHQVQTTSPSNNPFIDKEIVKFVLPIYIKTNGAPYIYLQPQYHNQDFPFEVVNGLIEGDYTNGQELNINTLIKIPKEQSTFNLKKGTVIAYLWSPEKLKLTYNPNLKKRRINTFIGFK